MAAGPLALHPALRPWYAAGLRYVYLDDEALKTLEESRMISDMAKAQAVPPQKLPDHSQDQGASVRYADRRPPQASANARRQTPPRAERLASRGPNGNQGEVQSQSPYSRHIQDGPQASTMPPEQWPQIWQERLASTLATAKGAPVLWTYWALGEDLSGAPNAPRRDILRRILGELNLPRGTHCFWPVAMPSKIAHKEQTQEIASQFAQEDEMTDLHSPKDMELEANAPIFLAGLDILAPRVCVLMGSKALRTILPNSTTGPFQQTQYGRLLFLVLPDMDMLLAESERIPRVVAYLRSALQSFMGRR